MNPERRKKRVQGEEQQDLLESHAQFQVSERGHPLSQDLVNVVLCLWARAKIKKIQNPREIVAD